MKRFAPAVLAGSLLLAGCGAGGGAAPPGAGQSPASTPSAGPAVWAPSAADTFQWQLSGTLDTTVPASVYDVDGFETTAATVAQLHALGRHAVCYVSAGTYENWRPDAASFPPSVIGNPDTGWAGEYWLDIRNLTVLGPIMQARLDMCKQKGFDAVEADNVDGYQNNTGFPLTAQDQLNYNEWFAQQTHARGMSIALKNDPGQVSPLLSYFDFALEEDCWQQGWCAQLAPFTIARKAVFTVEYTDVTSGATFHNAYCPQAAAAGAYALLKNRNLDAWRDTCP